MWSALQLGSITRATALTRTSHQPHPYSCYARPRDGSQATGWLEAARPIAKPPDRPGSGGGGLMRDRLDGDLRGVDSDCDPVVPQPVGREDVVSRRSGSRAARPV